MGEKRRRGAISSGKEKKQGPRYKKNLHLGEFPSIAWHF
jgi:hypothetical protein